MSDNTFYDYKEYIDTFYSNVKSFPPNDIHTEACKVAVAMRMDIMNFPDTIKAKGKTYYISNNGNDNNDGLSPETPWKTAEKLIAETENLKSGDAVLFERGGTWRKPITCLKGGPDKDALFVGKKGVSYGAYGKGKKPVLIGSPINFADSKLWKKTEYKDVYECVYSFCNAGVVALDHSDNHGEYDALLAHKEMIGRNSFEGIESFKEDNSYYNDVDTQKLYFYSKKGNPGKRFKRIEIGGRGAVIYNQGAALYENFDIKYEGYGIEGTPSMKVQGCVFSWLGGCQLIAKTGETVVCGNAVEIYGNCDGFTVQNCWMYQLCDTGVTHQQWDLKTNACSQKNISFEGNLIEYCHWSVEFNNPPAEDGSVREMINFSHSYNFLAMGGYGWGSTMFSRSDSATLYNCFGVNNLKNGVCEKNILYHSAGCLYRMRFEDDKDIVYKQNVNIQSDKCKIGFLFDKDYPYNQESIELLKSLTKQVDNIFITKDIEGYI